MDIHVYTDKIRRIEPASHKGQNGKVLVIGGSELFHAASKWALDVTSAMVDMVFYSSVPENNELIHEAKQNFWSGVVVPRGEIESYIEEADVILIGPGMTRNQNSKFQLPNSKSILKGIYDKPSEVEWENDTEVIVNYLLSKYPDKKWVVDAGALQMVDPNLLGSQCIVTPHRAEFLALSVLAGSLFLEKQRFVKDGEQYKTEFEIPGAGSWTVGIKDIENKSGDWIWDEERFENWFEKYRKEVSSKDDEAEWSMGKFRGDFITLSAVLHGTTVLRKGQFDLISRYHEQRVGHGNAEDDFEVITGGNAGMTKGGTGDALAGLVAGLYCFSEDPFAVAVVASYVNKQAGDELYRSLGPFFTTNQLVEQIPKSLKKVLGY